MPNAGMLAADEELDDQHASLARAILHGDVPAARRVAYAIARREAACIEPAQG